METGERGKLLEVPRAECSFRSSRCCCIHRTGMIMKDERVGFCENLSAAQAKMFG
jgi:hypothetical protein